VDPLNITAMACPALPLCPLAIAEAERGAPDILKRIRTMFDKVILIIPTRIQIMQSSRAIIVNSDFWDWKWSGLFFSIGLVLTLIMLFFLCRWG
jgi:hypothetical protein